MTHEVDTCIGQCFFTAQQQQESPIVDLGSSVTLSTKHLSLVVHCKRVSWTMPFQIFCVYKNNIKFSRYTLILILSFSGGSYAETEPLIPSVRQIGRERTLFLQCTSHIQATSMAGSHLQSLCNTFCVGMSPQKTAWQTLVVSDIP